MTDLVPLLATATAIVGTTGAGKSYTARGAVEQLLAQDRRVIIIDPTGVWWGLRSAAEDDPDGAGYSVVIFGGDHADIPITEHDGKAIAEAMATRQVQAIIDVSEMTGGEQTRFLTDFFETLYAKNKGALHLVLDEADSMAPQNPMPDTKRLSGIVDKIARRGRVKGFRLLMLTQRPAVLHKNVLSQIGTLIALKLTSPQDRKAIEDWVSGNADAGQAKEVMKSLPQLDMGEGWVWSPSAGVLERQRFPKITTFDSGRSPKDGDIPLEPVMGWVDVEELQQAMFISRPSKEAQKTNTVDQQIADDTQRIHDVNLAHQRGYDIGLAEGIQRGTVTGIAIGIARAGTAIDALRIADIVEDEQVILRRAPDKATAAAAGIPPIGALLENPQWTKDELRRIADAGTSGPVRVGLPPPVVSGSFTAPQVRVLRSLGMWLALGQEKPTKVMVAAAAGYKPGSGNFTNLLSQLRAVEAIDYPQPGHARLLATQFGMPIEEGRAALLGTMTAPQRKLFDALTHGEMSKDDLGAATDYSAKSGNFTNLLSQLRALGLVEYPTPGRVALVSWVFDIL